MSDKKMPINDIGNTSGGRAPRQEGSWSPARHATQLGAPSPEQSRLTELAEQAWRPGQQGQGNKDKIHSTQERLDIQREKLVENGILPRNGARGFEIQAYPVRVESMNMTRALNGLIADYDSYMTSHATDNDLRLSSFAVDMLTFSNSNHDTRDINRHISQMYSHLHSIYATNNQNVERIALGNIENCIVQITRDAAHDEVSPQVRRRVHEFLQQIGLATPVNS